MWSQWSGGPPPMPPSSANPQQALIGPVQPNTGAPPPSNPAPPSGGTTSVQPAAYPSSSGAPSYTPAQYAAMTPEQQYAVQQHWQQWQAYEQQYAQWHAQYGEQYKREMAAIHGGPPPTIPQYNSSSTPASAVNSFGFPPPAISNQYQAPPVPAHAPPPPPPDDNASSMGIKAPQQIYEQPPPPPPPPQSEEKQENNVPTLSQYQSAPPVQVGNTPASQITQGQESRWSQPPPIMQNQGSRWSDTGPQQDRQQQTQFNQRDRQQQNQFNDQDRQQQNQFNDQDRQQQNQFNQQFNSNSNNNNSNSQRGRQSRDQRDQQRDDQGRDNRQGNRQNNDFRGRNRGRGGNNFENNRQQQFDDTEGRNNRQQQSWQQSGSPGQRNSRGNYSNRFDNYDNYNSNMGQSISQQGSSGWNNNNPGNNNNPVNNTNQGNTFSSPEIQRQQQHLQNQNTPIANPQNNTKTTSVDEKAFDEQFRLWEEQFENWKKENANHPDRAMYMKYEQEFEKTRTRLLERREQMRRRKMMELQQSMPQQKPMPQQQLEDERPLQGSDQQKPAQEVQALKEDANVSETKQGEPSDMEQSENEDADQVTSKNQIKISTDSQEIAESTKIEAAETNVFKKNEITDLFKTADGGIPGLDLVEPKEDADSTNPPEGKAASEVIDLDNDGPSRPAKVPATSSSIATLLPSTVQQAPIKPSLPDLGSRLQASIINSQPSQRKIPSLFDIVVEKPVLSPEPTNQNESPARDLSPTASRSSKADIPSSAVEAFPSPSRSISKDRDLLASPGQRPLSQLSSISQLQHQKNEEGPNEHPNRQPFFNQQQQQQQHQQQQQAANLPPQTADLAKALQDPNVMQLLTVALAQAQQAGGCNPQQSQLIQQLQQLQPLLQMQHDRNSNNQPWNNPQSQRPQQPWQSQNQNQNSNNKITSNSNQNRNSWGGNPFNRNNDRNNQLSQNRGHVSGNESDDINDTQQRNPHNPFRRSVGGSGSDDNSGINQTLERDFEVPGGQNPFNNNDNNSQGISGLFGGPANAQQIRGSNFGGGNFGGNNFAGNNFGGTNFGGTNFGGGGGGPGGGRFDNNRPQSNFGNSLGFRNNPKNFGDRGGDDNDYYRPTQVFDYQNRSRTDAMVLPAKVVDYGHRPSAVMTSNSFNRDISEFVPVKTIDYGHASNSVQNENQFQRSNLNSTNNINRWSEHQPTNQRQSDSQEHTQSYRQPQFQGQAQFRHQNLNKGTSSETLQNKSGSFQEQNKQQQELQQKQNPIEVTKQINATSDGNTIEPNKSVENEYFNELEDENIPEYPNNKWILQNPETRERPGPPTKRGKRNAGGFQIQQKCSPPYSNTESDEIEENFEEISDNEDLSEITYNPPASVQFKAKSIPLFPSVSDSISNKPMVFPSMENNNTIPIDEILFKPGRLTRPKHIVIIIRGPPGSGKSHVAKLIKDKEVEMGGPTPRLLSIDDYFMIENDYVEKCPKTGRKIPKKEILYEYEKEMEDTYMQYLIKSFKKTITDHLFDFIIVDCCNQSLRTFNEFYNAARDGNFSPFIIDMICDVDVCLNQNIHNRTEDEIKDIIKSYQDCPGHYIKLDVSNLLENVVEMEDVSDLEDNFVADSEVVDLRDEDDDTNDNNDGGFLQSKWDTDPTTENLARLDGTSKPISKRGTATLEEYLQIDGWEPPTSNTNGKKRVRWADIEEKRAQDKMRAIGFVVGQTDWNRMMDPTSGSGALTKTKYIERLNKRR